MSGANEFPVPTDYRQALRGRIACNRVGKAGLDSWQGGPVQRHGNKPLVVFNGRDMTLLETTV